MSLALPADDDGLSLGELMLMDGTTLGDGLPLAGGSLRSSMGSATATVDLPEDTNTDDELFAPSDRWHIGYR